MDEKHHFMGKKFHLTLHLKSKVGKGGIAL
jgi:hypothetical protein